VEDGFNDYFYRRKGQCRQGFSNRSSLREKNPSKIPPLPFLLSNSQTVIQLNFSELLGQEVELSHIHKFVDGVDLGDVSPTPIRLNLRVYLGTHNIKLKF